MMDLLILYLGNAWLLKNKLTDITPFAHDDRSSYTVTNILR